MHNISTPCYFPTLQNPDIVFVSIILHTPMHTTLNTLIFWGYMMEVYVNFHLNILSFHILFIVLLDIL